MKKALLITTLAILLPAASWAQWDTLWFEDFEGDWTQNWYASAGTWDAGVPTSGPGLAYSGDSCAATNLSGDYPSGVNSRFVRYTTFVVPPVSQNPRLRFWHWFVIAAGDQGRVQAKTNNGNWADLTSYTYYSSGSSVWTVEEVDLSDWADSTIQIAFYFYSSTNYNAAGWYIDDVTILTGPYTFANPEGFESGYGDWSVERGTWEIGTPTNVGPVNCHTGVACAGTRLDGNYAADISTRLKSTWMTLGSGAAAMTFYHWFSIGAGDYGEVQVRTSTTNWATASVQWTGNSAGWTFYYLDLSAYADSTVQIGFYFASGTNYDGPGWYIDDIDIDINTTGTGISERGQGLTAAPNPFTGSVRLFVPSPSADHVQITDMLGGKLRTFNNVTNDGLTWDGRTTSGTEVPPGMYLVTVIADGQRYTQRVIKQ